MRKSALRLFVFTVAVAWSGIYTSAQTIQVNQNNRTIAVKVSDVAKADADILALKFMRRMLKALMPRDRRYRMRLSMRCVNPA